MKNTRGFVIFLIQAALICFILTCQPVIASCSDELPTIHHTTLSDTQSKKDISFSIYQPACYDERISGGYPVVYLLHGQNMNLDTWQELGLSEAMRDGTANLELPGFLIVTVQEDDYLKGMFFSDFDKLILQDVIPWVDENYHTCASRDCRAIGGISRGALWAEKIAFENPDVFNAVGLHSIPGTVFNDQTIKILTRKLVEKYPENPLRIYMDTGNSDPYRHDGRAISDQLNFLGYPHTRVVNEGGHDYDYWRKELLEYLIWYTEPWLP